MTTKTNTPGDRVQGEAKPGDRVTYHDMANQDGKVWEVVDRTSPARYMLMADDGTVNWTDLRQRGWTFA